VRLKDNGTAWIGLAEWWTLWLHQDNGIMQEKIKVFSLSLLALPDVYLHKSGSKGKRYVTAEILEKYIC
jgi:hypothetical protein